MKNKRSKIYQLSYRKQLIRLAKLYGVVEIKSYLKSAKRLTTAQIELLLVKNRIKLPLKKSLSKFNYLTIFKNKYLHQLYYTLAVVILIVGFFGGAPHLVKIFHKIDYNFWKNKNEIVKHRHDTIEKILEKNEVKTSENEEDFVFTENEQIEQDDFTDNTVRLNVTIVSSLFEDHDYDLSKIRKGTKVKPFYISLLPKDLSSIENYKEKKELFIKIVLPLILHENDKIEKDRKKLFKILAKKYNNKQEKNWLKWKFKEYKIKNSDISELKIRMDIIPVSIAIAQAAIESGWGTSRFALEGNALFGQWTYSGKGLKPLDNTDGDHKIMQFKILIASVKAYKKNLNTHSGYARFREARADLRVQNKKVTGLKLTKYLDKYAATGEQYTKKIELTIKKNALSDFESAKLYSVGLREGINL